MLTKLVIATFWAVAVAAPAFSQTGGPSADLLAGIANYNSGDFVAARQQLTAAAERGEAEAMVNLGYMLARGHGGNADPALALQLYQRAASLDDAEGMNAVGYRYEFAIPPDLEHAVLWYCRAIAGGNPRAMNNLAILLFYGTGLPQDRDQALDLWRQSAALGNPGAQTNLGAMLIDDPGAPAEDRALAAAMLRRAARRGNGMAQGILRRHGDVEAFPLPFDTSLLMVLEPRPPVSGTARVCGSLVS